MKIGLLACDFVNPEFLEISGTIPKMFVDLICQTKIDSNWQVYQVWEGEIPSSTEECEAWFISGSRTSVYEEKRWIKHFEKFVADLHMDKRKTIGICFGHQMIAQALGGEVRHSDRGWGIGVKEIDIIREEPWMNPPLDKMRMLFTHQDQVEKLPPEARLLGSADHCPHAMFAMDNHMLALQSHPEYSRAYLRALIQSREAIIDQPTFQSGLESLEIEPHRIEPAAWLRNFLTS